MFLRFIIFGVRTLSCQLKFCFQTSAARPAGSHITTTASSYFKAGSLTPQLFQDHTTVPAEKLNDTSTMKEFSTTVSPNTQTGGSSFNTRAEGTSESQSGNFPARFPGENISDVTVNSSAESSGVTVQLSTPLHTVLAPEQNYPQFNSTNRTTDQQEQTGLKWIW